MVRTTVLVVDDEESMRYFLTRALKKKGYEVTAVSNGEDALEELSKRSRDVLLLDLMLPGRDGIEILAEVKAARSASIVILMTGYGTVERALNAMRMGASDFVTKPFKIEEVLAKIEESLQRGAPVARPPSEAPTAKKPPPEAGVASRRMPPPRPLVPFLLETAERRGVPINLPEGGDLPYREASRLFETLYFLDLFERTAGNVSLAARIAGISRPSLHRKIHDLEIDVDRFRG